jgi:hypothetical protein
MLFRECVEHLPSSEIATRYLTPLRYLPMTHEIIRNLMLVVSSVLFGNQQYSWDIMKQLKQHSIQ